MLGKLLIASSLLVASGSVMALDEYISRPRVSITFGGGHHVYDHRDHYRYREVYVPRPVYVEPVYYNNYYYRGDSRRHQGWGHRAHHDDWRDHRQHKRHHRKHHDHDD